MDRVSKFLKKLTKKERERLEDTIVLILAGKLNGLDIKKLVGVNDIFRVRIGSVRIIFRWKINDIEILEVGHRNTTLYHKH